MLLPAYNGKASRLGLHRVNSFGTKVLINASHNYAHLLNYYTNLQLLEAKQGYIDYLKDIQLISSSLY